MQANNHQIGTTKRNVCYYDDPVQNKYILCETIHMYSGITSGRWGANAICPVDWRKISMKQSVGKCKQINF